MNSLQRKATYAALTKLFFLLLGSPAGADVITAVSCSEIDVRAALKATTAWTTQVTIAPGTCHWSSAELVLA